MDDHVHPSPTSSSSATSPPAEHLTRRLLRALENPLRFLQRSNNEFSILGATGNVYKVTLSATPSCTCPDITIPCKHILFVYVRLLSVSIDDPCIWHRTLEPSLLNRLLSTPVSATPPPNDVIEEPPDHLTRRLLRALENPLRLLRRVNNEFFILGATGNVYTVTLATAPSCTCPDSTIPCKHILFVYVRVLSVPLDDPCLWRRTLESSELTRILSAPVSSDAVAGEAIQQRYQEMCLRRTAAATPDGKGPRVEAEEGAMCPVCLEEMGGGGRKLVACETCKNAIHEECLMAWKRSGRKGSTSCVICRARWRGPDDEQEEYINLSAYVREDENNSTDDDDQHDDDDDDDDQQDEDENSSDDDQQDED